MLAFVVGSLSAPKRLVSDSMPATRSDEITNIKHRILINCKAHSLKNPEFQFYMYIFDAPKTSKHGAYNKTMSDEAYS